MHESIALTASGGVGVNVQWGVQIPLRDGVRLNATLYLPRNHARPSPAIITLTPYIGQTYHDRGLYFASHGYPFLTVDVRGRGNSEGTFLPFINEARDGFDAIEWLAEQPYCNGQVTMWGGSYGGYAQWAAAKEFPPHLATIAPVASPYLGVDFPGRSNLPTPYLTQWLTLVWGRTSQDKLFWNNELYWGGRFQEWFESGAAFRELDSQLGSPSAIFQEWLAHPYQDAYWDQYNPTAAQYAKLSLPILTITGSYDGDQPGALMHYKEHLENATPAGRARHYLVIGPWNHAGTRTPMREFCGLEVGPASLIDLPTLHLDWYAWTMQAGPKPQFLQKNVAYYVMEADTWRYADRLDDVTSRHLSIYLHAGRNPTDVFASGTLQPQRPAHCEPATYTYDPRDISLASLERTIDPENRAEQRMVLASSGKQLIYHSAPFQRDTEISGFFHFSAWIAIDQPDTDFRVSIYEIAVDGTSTLLSSDSMRARYRKSLRVPKLIDTQEALEYDFNRFTFVARLIRCGSRLRLVLGPINSIYSQKNYNSGGAVSEESMREARAVAVTVFQDGDRPARLEVPLGQFEDLSLAIFAP